jgi:hypothetical protein
LPYIGEIGTCQDLITTSENFDGQLLENCLVSHDEVCIILLTVYSEITKESHQYLERSSHKFGGHSFLHVLLKQIEALKFARDWKRRGLRPGGKRYKSHFVQSIFENRRDPVTENPTVNGDICTFKSFKIQHQFTITCRNYLLDMYNEVCAHMILIDRFCFILTLLLYSSVHLFCWIPCGM